VSQAAAMEEPLRPATLTDLLDGGYRLLRARPGTVLALSALFVVPGHVLAGMANRGTIEDLNALVGGSSLLFGADGGGFGSLLLTLSSAVVRSLGLLYLGVALTLVVLADRAGTRLGATAAAGAALRRSGPVLLSWPVLTIGSVASYLVCFLPLFVWLGLTAVVAPVIAAEGAGPMAAIGRSFKLTGRRFWGAVAVVALSALVVNVLDTILVIIPQAVAVALPASFGWVVAMAGAAAASTLTSGPLVLSCVLLYLDLRVRAEGLDLRQRAAAAFARAG
jgi:hypothetical protein